MSRIRKARIVRAPPSIRSGRATHAAGFQPAPPVAQSVFSNFFYARETEQAAQELTRPNLDYRPSRLSASVIYVTDGPDTSLRYACTFQMMNGINAWPPRFAIGLVYLYYTVGNRGITCS